MLDETEENGIPVLRVTEFSLVVVVDPGEHTFQSPRIRIFERRASFV